NVIHVDDHPTFSDFSPEYIVHHGLKCRWRVEHYQRFKKTSICPECRFPFITFFDLDVVVSPANVHFGEVFCLRQFIY
ncbi:hypothetical protein AMATHDRAFT_160161, partial [Amanita thiersii Skay4041]